MKNNNSVVIHKLTRRSLYANKKRNLFLVTAIFLTTLLLGAVFSIGGSLLKSFETEKLRLLGITAHGGIPYPTAQQIQKMEELPYVKMVGVDATLGFTKPLLQWGGISLQLVYCDRNDWEFMRKPACSDVNGSYPQAEDEIMMPLDLLKQMEIQPKIGAKVPLSYYTDDATRDAPFTQEFRLSGWYTSYGSVKAKGQISSVNISKALFEKHGKLVSETGAANFIFDDASRISDYVERLKSDLSLAENQQPVTAKEFGVDSGNAVTAALSLLAITAFLVLTGYLLIYNVLYISVSHDVRFYGLLKTLGTTPKQIKSIVRGQIGFLSAVGIPLGILAALLLSLVAVPAVLAGLNAFSTEPVVSFSPLIYLGAAGFALATAFLGAMKPAKKAAEITPVEAQKYVVASGVGSKKYKPAHGKPWRMALRNIFRDKKRAAIVLCSLFLGLSTFVVVTSAVSVMDMTQHIDTLFPEDFLLTNDTIGGRAISDGVMLSSDPPPQELFDSDFLAQMQALPGLEHLSVETTCYADTEGDKTLRFIGVDSAAIHKAADKLDPAIDIDAFSRGEFALLTTGFSDRTPSSAQLFAQDSQLIVTPILDESLPRRPSVPVPIGGSAPDTLANTQRTAYPTLIASDTLMQSLFGQLYLDNVKLDALPEYERQMLDALKALTKNTQIGLTSKLEALENMKKSRFVLSVLGTGISLVIALIGILNFINVMSTGIMVRKRELAILQSIGMEGKKICRMLVLEGLGYASIALLLTATLGTGAAYGVFYLLALQGDYAVFSYPIIPVAILSLLVVAVCILSPQRAYRSICKATVVERLREAE